MQVTATYEYRDADGTVLFGTTKSIDRDGHKTFRQWRPDGSGGRIWGLDGVKRVPYRLPELLAAIAAGVRVIVVEGERDVGSLVARGYVATTFPMGAGKWRDDYLQYFHGAQLEIIADADDPGRKHAHTVAAHLEKVGLVLRVSEPPRPYKDITEMLEAGLTLEDLEPCQYLPFEDSSNGAGPEHSTNGDGPVPHLAVVDGAKFALDEPKHVNALWGADSAVLWAEGEPLMIYGPDGVGKTTIAQQLVCARIGIRDPELFQYPVAPTKAKVLYLALDRPRQAARSFRRMVEEKDRELLHERLVVWRGSLPFDVVRDPEALCRFVGQCEADTVVIDSLKDVAMKLSDEDTGMAIHKASQFCVEAGIEVLSLHHPRKAQAENKKPKTLADVYGSRWLTAGCGSVLLVWGDAGDAVVAVEHLKQPVDIVGPLEVLHNNRCGRTFVIDSNDVVQLVAVDGGQPTAREIATALSGKATPTRNQVEQARRKLDAAVEKGVLEAVTVTTRGGEGKGYIVASGNVHAKGPRTSTHNVHGESPRAAPRSEGAVDLRHVHVHGGTRNDEVTPEEWADVFPGTTFEEAE